MSKFTLLPPSEICFKKPKANYVIYYDNPIISVVEDRKGEKYIIDEKTGEYKKIKNPFYIKLNKKNIRIFHDNRLEIIKKNGYRCYVTDFAILLGARTDYRNYPLEENGRTIIYSTKEATSDYTYKEIKELVIYINDYGEKRTDYADDKLISSRPKTKYSEIKGESSSENINNKGVIEVEYGEYPQMVVFEDLSKTLEKQYQNGKLKKTGKYYTTNKQSEQPDWYCDEKFEERKHQEYEYKGKNTFVLL